MAAVLSGVVSGALAQAGLWEGDLGVVVRAGLFEEDDPAGRAMDAALSLYSQVPNLSVCAHLGETFAAGFPLECAAAALVVSEDSIPGKTQLQTVSQGVEIWKEQEPPAMLGDSALVVGLAAHSAVAAVLRAI